MKSKAKIRLVSPWSKLIETETAIFSAEFSVEEADALICEWAPSKELFSFRRRKAWYCCEPKALIDRYHSGWKRIRSRLQPHEVLCHNHSQQRFRVPHISHFEKLEMNCASNRRDKAIAIVSNFGGSPYFRPHGLQFRNRFVTHQMIDLYGRDTWRKYRRDIFSRTRMPSNYSGTLPGDWPGSKKRETMARYKVCVCLENSTEPYYFTEKFVEAVTAGCIPVFTTHPTIASTTLLGAQWIDPADFDNDVDATLEAAISADIGRFQDVNAKWLKSASLKCTGHLEIFQKIAEILVM